MFAWVTKSVIRDVGRHVRINCRRNMPNQPRDAAVYRSKLEDGKISRLVEGDILVQVLLPTWAACDISWCAYSPKARLVMPQS